MKISKSKRQLAQLLIEAGVRQFPDGAEWAAQDKDDKTVYMHKIRPPLLAGCDHFSHRYTVRCRSWLLPVVIPNWYQTVLSRAEFDQIVAESAEQSNSDAGGWIEWKGGKCPVPTGVSVDVKYRDGREELNLPANQFSPHRSPDAAPRFWVNDNHKNDIVAYRLHNPEQAEPQYCESVTRAIPEPIIVPTLDQLLQDYRNAVDFAAAKHAEADEAAKMRDERWMVVQARALDLRVRIIAGLAVDAEMRESEPVITDWRDLRAGDVIAFTGSDDELEPGEYEVCDTEGVDYTGKYSIRVSTGKLGRKWISNDSWHFIRRP